MDHEILSAGTSSAVVEGLYASYCNNPDSVDASWRAYFDALHDKVTQSGPSWARATWPLAPSDDLSMALIPGLEQAVKKEQPKGQVSAEAVRQATLDSIRALMLIRTYRVRGHLRAKLDPLGLEERPANPELDPSSYGFVEADMNRPIFLNGVMGLEMATLREIMDILNTTYCGSVGVEFMHINEPDEKTWIQNRIEGRKNEIQFTPEGKKAILQKLIEAEQFEKFLGKKYVGTKRFGLDGGEAMVPALEAIIKTGGQLGIDEIVLGMPHRGRLNVLTNVMQKPYRAIFHEFHGGSANPDDVQGSGDVKYHLGTSSDRDFDGNPVHLSLTANPSHLEAVDPVVLGKVRAKQHQKKDIERKRVMALLLHGDAAFSGQGLVAECFMLSGLKSYQTGGTIHFVVNNQIGFTTSPQYSRSSPYPSDVAKMVQAPIFHVNGDDPEAVVWVTKLATEYRQTFKKDVVIDMFCYRRFGHNESDEPSFTQPLMYANIKNHLSVATIYKDRLISEGQMSDKDYDTMVDAFINRMEADFVAAEGYKPDKADWFGGRWVGFGLAGGGARRAPTGVNIAALREVGKVMTTVPENFNLHRTLGRVLAAREEAITAGAGIDWATAEQLAFGTLLLDGYGVRLSGQDSKRGTFSQRHAEFVDQKTEKRYRPLNSLPTEQRFVVIDSPLSEVAVMGYEYGYSLAEPMELVLWEAQFGDFANGAQMIIDQFISSGEAKWLRMSGLVLLLPHGYEGQGPEHSSAHPERYLQLCAEDNMQVANVTTPAQYFHLLRRQMLRNFRKPLVIFTPKSLLRHKKAVSNIDMMTAGSEFHRVLWDDSQTYPADGIKLKADKDIKRVILCTGKIYYDIEDERNARNQSDTHILRVEQLFPFPKQPLVNELKRFGNVEKVIWCQEEPKNLGYWSFIESLIEESLIEVGCKPQRATYAGRAASAATATGLASVHAKQQATLIDQALTF